MSESTKRPAPLGDDSMHSEKRQRPENDADDITALNRVNALLDDALSLANAAFPATLNAGDNAALRKARRLARALMNALPVDPTTELIAYEKHQKYAEAVIKKLENSCANDWHDGYDYQEARMKDIGRDVGKWLPILWNALNESDADVELIWTCLHFSSKTTAFLRTVRTRHDYSIESVKVTITSGDGTVVYNENRHIDTSLLWMWRELLVHCEAHAFPTAPILMNMGQLNITSKVFDRIRQNGDREGDANASGVKFWDQHWDETTQNAAKRVCAARHAEQMSQFLKNPSLAVYRSLLQTNPIIRPVLTDTVRAHMADRKTRTMSLIDAIEIFGENSMSDEIVALIGLPLEEDEPASQAVVKYLSKQTTPEHHQAGLKVLEAGVDRAKCAVLSAVEDALPFLYEGQQWYNEQVAKLGAVQNKIMDSTLEKLLRTAVSKAEGRLMDGRYHIPGSERLTSNIRSWVELLLEWPEEAEAAAVWDKMRLKEDSADPFGLPGLMKFLRFHFEETPRYPISEGVRCMAKVYSCKTLQELRQPSTFNPLLF